MTDITPIFTAIIALFVALITAFIIPFLRERTDDEALRKLILLAQTGVSAAEQLLTSSTGAEKKAYVWDFLRRYDLTADEVEIDAAIEAAVLNLHRTFEVSK